MNYKNYIFQFAGYPAFFNIRCPAGYPASQNRYLDVYRIFEKQRFGSQSAWIRIQLFACIRIRLSNADPDLDRVGLKRAKMKKNAHIKDRYCNWA
jgi:hypothetical protein